MEPTIKCGKHLAEHADISGSRFHDVNLGEVVEPQEFGLDPIARVHAIDFIEFMRTAHAGWKRSHGDTDALPIEIGC